MKLPAKTLLLAAAIGATLVVIGLFFGGRPEVAVASIRRDLALDAVPAAVKVSPEFQVTITSDVLGLVRKSNLKIGQVVKEGDVLFEIDTSKYELALSQLENQLSNTREQFALDLDQRNALDRRKEDLVLLTARAKAGEYPQFELKRREEELAMFIESQGKDRLVRARHIADLEHAIALIRKDIADCVVRAPAAGTVTELFAQPGEVVALRAPLVRLFSQALLVEARINEEDFSGIQPGLDASVRFLAYGPELYPAKVVKVLPNADPLNQQYRAYLEVAIPAALLIPGLSGEASVIRNRRAGALIAPRAALNDGAVFVIEDGVARRRPVTVGFRSLSAVEILTGVAENAEVAVTQIESLREGIRVKVGR
jgi:multidrug efflux pump subunit AcrA (membrane-fusion protein)